MIQALIHEIYVNDSAIPMGALACGEIDDTCTLTLGESKLVIADDNEEGDAGFFTYSIYEGGELMTTDGGESSEAALAVIVRFVSERTS